MKFEIQTVIKEFVRPATEFSGFEQSFSIQYHEIVVLIAPTLAIANGPTTTLVPATRDLSLITNAPTTVTPTVPAFSLVTLPSTTTTATTPNCTLHTLPMTSTTPTTPVLSMVTIPATQYCPYLFLGKSKSRYTTVLAAPPAMPAVSAELFEAPFLHHKGKICMTKKYCEGLTARLATPRDKVSPLPKGLSPRMTEKSKQLTRNLDSFEVRNAKFETARKQKLEKRTAEAAAANLFRPKIDSKSNRLAKKRVGNVVQRLAADNARRNANRNYSALRKPIQFYSAKSSKSDLSMLSLPASDEVFEAPSMLVRAQPSLSAEISLLAQLTAGECSPVSTSVAVPKLGRHGYSKSCPAVVVEKKEVSAIGDASDTDCSVNGSDSEEAGPLAQTLIVHKPAAVEVQVGAAVEVSGPMYGVVDTSYRIVRRTPSFDAAQRLAGLGSESAREMTAISASFEATQRVFESCPPSTQPATSSRASAWATVTPMDIPE